MTSLGDEIHEELKNTISIIVDKANRREQTLLEENDELHDQIRDLKREIEERE